MPKDAKAKALADAKRAQLDYERDVRAAGEARRKSFARAQKSGSSLADIGEAVGLHRSRVGEILRGKYVLAAEDRALWATALYAGLRYGELRALRWSAVDLAGGSIRVTESWDPKEGAIAPKTKSSQRTTPLPGLLRDYLIEHRIAAGEPPPEALVFGDKIGKPFQAATIYRRADRAWEARVLGRLRLHQARHTYASFMIAAGVNAKALSSFMGHSSIKVTFDLYGHLMPGTEAEAAALLDRYLTMEGQEKGRTAALA